MGWLDYHLWEMVINGQTYGLPMKEDWGTAPRKVASRTRLRNVLAPGTTRIDYIYDFGDYWEHELTVSDVRAGDPVTAYPRFIAGERDCPPEDCGEIGRAHVCTPVTNAHIVCRLLLEQKTNKQHNHQYYIPIII